MCGFEICIGLASHVLYGRIIWLSITIYDCVEECLCPVIIEHHAWNLAVPLDMHRVLPPLVRLRAWLSETVLESFRKGRNSYQAQMIPLC